MTSSKAEKTGSKHGPMTQPYLPLALALPGVTHRSVDVESPDDADSERDDGGDQEAGVRHAGQDSSPGPGVAVRLDLDVGIGAGDRDGDIGLHQRLLVLETNK